METIAALDIGTSKIACLVAEREEESRRLRVIGVGVVPSRGIKKGVIVDINDVTDAIEAALSKAEHTSGVTIDDAFVGVAGSHISALNSRGTVSVSRSNHSIESGDVQRVLDEASAIAIPHPQEVVHVIPRGFWLDGENGVRDPVGLHGYKLEVEAHIVTAAATALQTIERCCDRAGLHVNAFVLEPLASGEAVLTEDERELGVVLVDIGGGTTDVSVFLEGSVWHTVCLPIGGYHLSHDLAVGLQCALPVAEKLKIKHGVASPELITDDEPIEVTTFGDAPLQGLTQRDIAEILEYRVLDIFDGIQQEMKRSGYDGLLPAGIVFCGGSSQLSGLREMASSYFDLPVRVARPKTDVLRGLVDTLNSPAYATTIGLLEWGAYHHQMQPDRSSTNGHHPKERWWNRITTWMRTLLPG